MRQKCCKANAKTDYAEAIGPERRDRKKYPNDDVTMHKEQEFE